MPVRRSPPAPGSCGIGGKVVNFVDLPKAMTLSTDTGGVITNFLGNWHGLSIHGFYGIWNAPDASLLIPNAARCAGCPHPEVNVLPSCAQALLLSCQCGPHDSAVIKLMRYSIHEHGHRL